MPFVELLNSLRKSRTTNATSMVCDMQLPQHPHNPLRRPSIPMLRSGWFVGECLRARELALRGGEDRLRVAAGEDVGAFADGHGAFGVVAQRDAGHA